MGFDSCRHLRMSFIYALSVCLCACVLAQAHSGCHGFPVWCHTSVKSTYSPSSFGIFFFFICPEYCVFMLSSLGASRRCVVRRFLVSLNPNLCIVSRMSRYTLNRVAPNNIAMTRMNRMIILSKVNMFPLLFLCQLFLLPSVFADCVNSDMMTYRGMIRQKLPMNPDHAMMATHSAMNMYFISLPFHPHCLNLRANIGSSATSSQQHSATSIMSTHDIHGELSSHLLWVAMSEPQNRAFAGVGMPMNDVVWRSSRLNFARRSAENAAIMNAMKGRTARAGSRNGG